MKQMGIQAQIRKKKRFYGKKEAYVVSDNLLNREFHADRPNQKWVTIYVVVVFGCKNVCISQFAFVLLPDFVDHKDRVLPF